MYNVIDRSKSIPPFLFFFFLHSSRSMHLHQTLSSPLLSLSPSFCLSPSSTRSLLKLSAFSLRFLPSSLRSPRSDRASFSKSIELYPIWIPYSDPLIHDQRSSYLLSPRSSTNLRLSPNSSSSLPSFLTLFRALFIPAPVALSLSFFLFPPVLFALSCSCSQRSSTALSFAPPFPVTIRRSRAAGGTEKRRP